MINLKIFPQTALLMLIDSLRSTDRQFKLDLYIDSDTIGGALFEVSDSQQEGKLLFVENDLQALMSKFLASLHAAAGEGSISEAVVQAERPEPETTTELGLGPSDAVPVGPVPDATGAP